MASNWAHMKDWIFLRRLVFIFTSLMINISISFTPDYLNPKDLAQTCWLIIGICVCSGVIAITTEVKLRKLWKMRNQIAGIKPEHMESYHYHKILKIGSDD